MGNSTSSTRKSAAVHRHAGPFRKSYQSQSNHHNLEEEFSDLILHEVKRQKQEQALERSQSPEAPSLSQNPPPGTGRSGKDKFTDDLIEDEFNELSHGILENEELSRNILPVDGSEDDTAMEVDEYNAAGSASSTDLEDITKVDFTKISSPAAARQPSNYANSTSRTKGNQGGMYANKANGVHDDLVPVRIKWVNQTREAISKVSIIGSFSNWRNVIKLKQQQGSPNEYQTTIKLPLGVHKLLYVVNNEYRVSEWLPTATDQEGIFFNWFEVLDPQHLFTHAGNHSKSSSTDEVNIVQTAGEHNANQIQQKSNSFLAKMSKKEKEVQHEHVEYPEHHSPQEYSYASSQNSSLAPSHDPSYVSLLENGESSEESVTYSSEIPEMLVDYNFFKNKSPDYELPEPPQLPAHLNNVLLNKMSAQHQPPPAPQPQTLSIPHMGGESTAPKRPALRRADSSYYASNKEAYHRSIPNHVILNHLMTTSIRNDVLTVACITRYSGKFVTQIMHSPADTGSTN